MPMGDYEDTLEDIKKTLGIIPGFMSSLPEDVPIHDWVLMKKYRWGESVIDPKVREFIGPAIAANLKCPYCRLMHLNMAKARGATEEELAELFYLTSFTSRWSSMLNAQHYDMKQFEKEASKIGDYLSQKEKVVQQILWARQPRRAYELRSRWAALSPKSNTRRPRWPLRTGPGPP